MNKSFFLLALLFTASIILSSCRQTATIAVTTPDSARATCSMHVVPNPGIGDPTATTDPGVVINGIRWATRNVDTPGTFAAAPESAGRLFQWGTLNGVTHHFDNTTSGAVSGWYDNATSHYRVAWTPANNPCPQGWRVPTQQELQSLNRVGSVWMTYNGVRGRLYGTAPNAIFLPAAGFRVSGSGDLFGVGTDGYYWSSQQVSYTHAILLWFYSEQSLGFGLWVRADALSVRCVQE